MNLPALRQFADSIEQRSKRAGVKRLIKTGRSKDEAILIIESLRSKLTHLSGEMRNFYEGIVRWIAQNLIDITDSKQLTKLNKLLYNLKGMPELDLYDRNFNNQTFDQVVDCIGVDLSDEVYEAPEDVHYEVFELNPEAFSRYIGKTSWCILDKFVYRDYTASGRKYFIAERSDFTEVPKSKGDTFPHDDYGMSLIAIGVENGEIVSVTSRWNFDEFGDSFLTESQLKKLLGRKFEELFPYD